MATTIAQYYTEELEKWNHQVASYRREMFEMGNDLVEVIRRNTIPGIAAIVKQKQDKLNKISKKIDRLQTWFQKQGVALKTDHRFLDDTLINPETEKLQNELRQLMQRSEKEYIDTKHDCSNFLSDIFKRKKD